MPLSFAINEAIADEKNLFIGKSERNELEFLARLIVLADCLRNLI